MEMRLVVTPESPPFLIQDGLKCLHDSKATEVDYIGLTGVSKKN